MEVEHVDSEHIWEAFGCEHGGLLSLAVLAMRVHKAPNFLISIILVLDRMSLSSLKDEPARKF